jgi:hypothetical protein
VFEQAHYKPWPEPAALAFHIPRPGQSRHQAMTVAWLGLAYSGPAWPEAGPCTSLTVCVVSLNTIMHDWLTKTCQTGSNVKAQQGKVVKLTFESKKRARSNSPLFGEMSDSDIELVGQRPSPSPETTARLVEEPEKKRRQGMPGFPIISLATEQC